MVCKADAVVNKMKKKGSRSHGKTKTAENEQRDGERRKKKKKREKNCQIPTVMGGKEASADWSCHDDGWHLVYTCVYLCVCWGIISVVEGK